MLEPGPVACATCGQATSGAYRCQACTRVSAAIVPGHRTAGKSSNGASRTGHLSVACGTFRTRVGAIAYLVAIGVLVAGLALLVTTRGAWCSAPRGTPGVVCTGPSRLHEVGFAVMFVGWLGVLVAAKVVDERVRGGRLAALLYVCLGLAVPAAYRRAVRGGERK